LDGGLAFDAVEAATPGGAPVLLTPPFMEEDVVTEGVRPSGGAPGGGSSRPARPQPASASAANVKQERWMRRAGTAGSEAEPI